ncbi:DUF4219 domain-containing protein [Cephalotus follicularis]|uniref:DUF4219 domain-containing protein n=1 Tax=Cephalotus follicularis TaxID=3775 RepID=A0A1Q3BNY7_CEPFO|nr:DUF4219 domain-containing protein [Cephalotus follicularis]
MNLNVGSSITRPPFFDGINYSFWKTRMTIFLQSLDYQLWHIIINGPRIPMRTIEGVESIKPENEYNDSDFRMLQLHSKANMFYFVPLALTSLIEFVLATRLKKCGTC